MLDIIGDLLEISVKFLSPSEKYHWIRKSIKRVAKKTLINWSEAAQSAFEVLKELCVNAPILAFPDYKLPFILHTDSSTEGLGAVLYQNKKVNLGLYPMLQDLLPKLNPITLLTN